MKTFPMFLKVAGRQIVIIGGGEQAAQKARLALKTEAKLVIVAPSLEAELQSMVAEDRATHVWVDRPDLFGNTALVFVATGCKGADAAWHGRAKAAGALVNVVDYPDLCDAMTPSIVDRDPVVVAIGTEGTAPVLGRRIKTQVEQILHLRLGAFAALAGRLRAEVARYVSANYRRAFWRWVFGGGGIVADIFNRKRTRSCRANQISDHRVRSGQTRRTADHRFRGDGARHGDPWHCRTAAGRLAVPS